MTTQVAGRRAHFTAGKAALVALVLTVVLLPVGIVAWPLAGNVARREGRSGLVAVAVLGFLVSLASVVFFLATRYTSR